MCKSSRILTETAISGRSRPYHREPGDRRWRIAPAAPPGRLTAPTSLCKQGQGNMSKNNHRQPPFHSLGRPAQLSRTELHVVSRSADANRNIDSEPPTAPEPFVTAKEAARFLCLSVRRVLEMARVGPGQKAHLAVSLERVSSRRNHKPISCEVWLRSRQAVPPDLDRRSNVEEPERMVKSG